MLTPFRKIFTNLKDLTAIQANVANTLASFNTLLLDGSTLTVEFTGGVTSLVVNHKLNRKLTGWIVTDKNANSNNWVTESDDKSMTIHSTADVILKLYIF